MTTRRSVTRTAKTAPKTDTKQKAVAFLNWSLPIKNADGEVVQKRTNRGFPIFNNQEEYPNENEALLVKLAQEKGGSVEITLKCRVTLVDQVHTEPELNQIVTG